MTTSSKATTIQDKFDALEAVLNVELVERRSEVRASMLALVAGVSIFFLGPPGVAKSMLANRIRKYIAGMSFFEILMTRFTQPEEVFGPVSLKALEDDRFEHQIDGYLATANACMIDEIFKANSSILNALLMAINERRYRHGTEMLNIPLTAVFCASNELPTDSSLNALYDRLLYRFEVKPISDARSFLEMLRTDRPSDPEPILTWEEISIAQAEAAKIVVPDSVYEDMTELRKQLRAEGIEPTERRFVQSLDVIKASAWLDARTMADREDLRCMEHIMWELPDQRATVSKVVLALANPLDNQAHALLEELEKLEEQLDGLTNEDERHRIGREVHRKIKQAKVEFDELEKRAGTSRRRSEIIAKTKDKLGHLTDRVLMEVFKVDPAKVDKP